MRMSVVMVIMHGVFDTRSYQDNRDTNKEKDLSKHLIQIYAFST